MRKVLIVDDAYFMRNLIKKALREAGYEVVGEAKNGAEGLQMYKNLQPDLVTMDIKMPDISGIDVTRQILSEFPKAKIIAITGNNDENIKKEMLLAGAKDYLRKPFQPAFLLTKIEGMLQEEEPGTPVLEEEASVVIAPFQEEAKKEEEIDDFFKEDVEVELLDKPDEAKSRLVVIENEEDLFEFPQEYPAEEEAELHSLTMDSPFEVEVETEEIELAVPEEQDETPVIHLTPSATPSPSLQEQETPLQEEVTLPSESVTVYEEPSEQDEPSSPPHSDPSNNSPEFTSPIRIRPPRGKMAMQQEDEQEDEEDVYDFIIDTSSEQITMTPEKKKGVFGVLKKLFKS